jgi:hypothetical protein
MTFPASDVDTGHVDSPTTVGDPALARADILDLIQKFNQLRAHFSSFMSVAINTWADEATIRTAIDTYAKQRVNSMPANLVGLTIGECFVATADFTINALTAGGVYAIYNNSGSTLTITQGAGVTMKRADSTTSGTRQLVGGGMATVWARTSTELVISGSGVL